MLTVRNAAEAAPASVIVMLSAALRFRVVAAAASKTTEPPDAADAFSVSVFPAAATTL